MLENIFGSGTTLSNGILSIPLGNFTCFLEKRYIAASLVNKIYQHLNGYLLDSDNYLLIDECNVSVGWLDTGQYEIEVKFRTFSSTYLRTTYDVSFMD